MLRMSFGKKKARVASTAVLFAAVSLLFGTDAGAQPRPGAPGGKYEAAAADPLNCWWKADKSSVRIGEEFTVTLTCRSAETAARRTVVNESLLDPGAVILTPYRLKGGSHARDISRVVPGPEGPVTLRTVRYAYTVALLGEGFFGKDVPLPPLEIRYHVDFVTNTGTVTTGKERVCLLAPLPLRVQSLVPRSAESIREADDDPFGDSQQRRKSAITAFVAAGLLLLLPPGVLLPALVRNLRRRRVRGSDGAAFGRNALLWRLKRMLEGIGRRLRTADWDDASVGSVLTALRVAGAMALGRRIIQVPVDPAVRGVEGQLAFRRGFRPRSKVLVSASLTPEEMARELVSVTGAGDVGARRSALLAETQRAFAALSAARYGAAAGPGGRAVCEAALAQGLRLVRALRREGIPLAGAIRRAGDRYRLGRRQWRPS